MKSRQLFEIRFCKLFSGMRFSTQVFEHAKIITWHHYNSDIFKIQYKFID